MTYKNKDSNGNYYWVKNCYEYDAGNRMTQDNGTDEYFYNYNQFNQLTQIAKNSASTLFETYQYDGRGNQTKEQVQKDFNGTVKMQTTDYTYDLMNQMT